MDAKIISLTANGTTYVIGEGPATGHYANVKAMRLSRISGGSELIAIATHQSGLESVLPWHTVTRIETQP